MLNHTVENSNGKFSLLFLGLTAKPACTGEAPGEEVIHALWNSHCLLYLLYLNTCLLAVSCPNCRIHPFTKTTNVSLSVAYKLCGPRPLLLSRPHSSLQRPHILAGMLLLSLCPVSCFPGVCSFYYRVVFEYMNCQANFQLVDFGVVSSLGLSWIKIKE